MPVTGCSFLILFSSYRNCNWDSRCSCCSEQGALVETVVRPSVRSSRAVGVYVSPSAWDQGPTYQYCLVLLSKGPAADPSSEVRCIIEMRLMREDNAPGRRAKLDHESLARSLAQVPQWREGVSTSQGVTNHLGRVL